MRLITFLIGKLPVMMNMKIDGGGIKDGWAAVGTSPNHKIVITPNE